MKDYGIGDLVLLHLNSPGPVGITQGLRRHQGREFRISRRKSIGAGKSGIYAHYYELEGCTSDKGVPFGITDDWIRRADEHE